ncbi:MAG TPA: hypothetical protein VFM69_12530 [Pricia sp.]|nr:hypothetical protein [Pricia sp.]
MISTVKYGKLKDFHLIKWVNGSILLVLYVWGATLLAGSEEREADRERDALVDLYESTNGSGWTTNWNLRKPVSEWHGVKVVNGRVVEIDLFRNNLTGRIPRSIGNLKHLVKLDLGFNALGGELPQSLVSLSNLKILKLEMNRIRGMLPADIGALEDLEELSAFNNFLSGKIPVGIGKLRKLKVLNLSGNSFGGEIPKTLGNLAHLERLGLFGNTLEGPIPPELGNLSKLKELVLAHNCLEGEIPEEFAQLNDLVIFQIQHNRFDSFKNLGHMVSKRYLVFDYDREEAKREYRDINSKTVRMADTRFEDDTGP